MRRTYIGKGVEGKLAEALDLQRRAQRRAETDTERTFLARVQAICDLTREFAFHVTALADATFIAAGFHRHDRGQWRRRRPIQGQQEPMDELMLKKDDLIELLALAKSNDQTAIVRLQDLLDVNAAAWKRADEIAEQARRVLITETCGTDLFATELMRSELQRVRDSLASESALPIIKLLADFCAMCRTQAHRVDVMMAGVGMKPVHSAGVQKKLRTIHNRYMKALRTLATAQRFLVDDPRTPASAPMTSSPAIKPSMSMAG